MCGIAGYVLRDSRASAKGGVAAQMADAMFHRGPDAGGLFTDGPAALSHRRLRIIDLSERAAQPMSTPDRRFTVVYNGEIYNYRELRGTLQAHGVQFRSQSDTEVLLQLYAAHGRDMLSLVNGIFAFAIWDAEARVLFAARDHLGVKPLYYAIDGSRLWFASEVKAILAGGYGAALNVGRVGEAIAFGAVAGEHTLFAGVQRLLPGGWFEFRDGSLRQGRYFDPSATGSVASQDGVSAAQRVEAALARAVEAQMVSDVPVGAMCSGGLDSSAVTALATRHHPGINTYCIRIDAPGCDESPYGRAVAEHCGTRHHELESRSSSVGALLPTLVWLHDEPLRHPNSIPIFEVSRLARESIIVLLSGEGADEIFAGYGRYGAARLMGRLRRVLRGPARALAPLGRPLARRFGRAGHLKALTALSAAPGGDMLVGLQAAIDVHELGTLLPDVPVDLSTRRGLADAAWQAAGADAVQAALLYDQATHLATLLDRQDKMCMGTSVESRVPFLDIDLVRLANGLPSALKLRGTTTKAVLRDALSGTLPDRVASRSKYAFGLPLRRWLLETDFFGLLQPMLQGELVRSGMLAPRVITDIARRVQVGSMPHADLLWNVMNLEIWMSVFISKTRRPDLAELPAYREPRMAGALPS